MITSVAPERALSGKKHREDALGFGAAELVPLLTPMILAGVHEAYKILADDTVRQLGSKVGKEIGAMVRKRFGGSKEQTVPLTSEQLERIHAATLKRLGADTPRAADVANAVVAALVLPS